MYNVHLKEKYISFVAFLFFFFFVSIALSPEINGRTVYLYLIIPFFDIYFDNHLISIIKSKVKIKYVASFTLLICLCVLNVEFFLVVRIMSIILCLIYLDYSQKNKRFKYLYHALNINIFIAILQFILSYINPEIAYLLGPTNVSRIIWGESFATQTFTNFYVIFDGFFVRVSGWSREAGFFAALIIISVIYYHFFEQRHSKWQYLLFAIGFITSFSKMSIMIIPMFLVMNFRHYLRKIPMPVMFAIWIAVLGTISGALAKIGYFDNISHSSMMHRLSGYDLIYHLSLKDFLVGFGSISRIDLNSISGLSYLSILAHDYDNLCGFPGIVQSLGALGLIIYIVSIDFMGITSDGLLLLLFASIDVDLFTTTSFVILAYWAAIKIQKK